MIRAQDVQFQLTRTFSAPVAQVFQMWTDVDHFAQWWGPKGFTVPVCKADFQVGGALLYCMKAPNGMEMWGKFVFQEIVPNQQIAFINYVTNENGEIMQMAHMPDWPLGIINDIRFEADGNHTILHFSAYPYEGNEKEWNAFDQGKNGLGKGFEGTFEKMETYLETLS
ncbi:MAG: SRPBCC domain-containing protein [Bacteroidota bacterium]